MTRMLPAADCASRNRLASVVEWSTSSPSIPDESKKAVLASSNETPCLVLLLAAFLVPHSNTNYVYTKLELCASWLTSGEPVFGRVPPRSRRFLSEKQGSPSPRVTKRGQSTLHHGSQSEKTPDPFVLPLQRPRNEAVGIASRRAIKKDSRLFVRPATRLSAAPQLLSRF